MLPLTEIRTIRIHSRSKRDYVTIVFSSELFNNVSIDSVCFLCFTESNFLILSCRCAGCTPNGELIPEASRLESYMRGLRAKETLHGSLQVDLHLAVATKVHCSAVYTHGVSITVLKEDMAKL